jgi:hypothetical protein
MLRYLCVTMIAVWIELFASIAFAERATPWTDGQQLISGCSSQIGSMREDECVNYIEGIKDLINSLIDNKAQAIRYPCTLPSIYERTAKGRDS